MQLLFIRHGDPDYKNDTLTEQGCIEAASLAKHIDYWKIDESYISPLGRARKTAEYSLEAMGLDVQNVIATNTRDWLREFDGKVDVVTYPEFIEAYPDTEATYGRLTKRICWDMMPAYLNKHPEYYETWGWRDTEIASKSNIIEKYDNVCTEFDKLLADYGYVRDGMCYRVEKESDVTLAFFCHFGLTCVVMSHLCNMSPFALWQGLSNAPTSVTQIFSEEREQGVASFRAWKVGDVSHLIQDGITPSFSARFAEKYSNKNERH